MNLLKFALRFQMNYKWFTLVNLAGLTVGVMFGLVILLYVHAHLSTDKFHPDADRIYRVVLDIHTPGGGTEYHPGTSVPLANALRNDISEVEMAAFCRKFYRTPTITIRNGNKTDKYLEDNIAYADHQFIHLFTHDFIAGDKATALVNPGSVVITERTALRYFGKTDVVNQIININNVEDLIVTGVIRNHREHSDVDFDLLVSLPTLMILTPNFEQDNFTWIGENNWTFVKLRDAENLSGAIAGIDEVEKKYLGKTFAHWQLQLQPLSDMHFDRRYGGAIDKSVLWILVAISVALIVVVSINYINLTIAQSHYRVKEIAVRRFLGSGRKQLFLQFMAEAAITVTCALIAALMSVYLSLPLLNYWLSDSLSLTQFMNPGAISLLIALAGILIFLAGYYPAVVLSGTGRLQGISGGFSKNRLNHHFGKLLISLQYVVAITFLLSSVIITGQIRFMLNKDLGFTSSNILNIDLLRRNASGFEAFRNEVASLPEVTVTSLHNQPPFTQTSNGGFIRYENRPEFEDFIVRDAWIDQHFLQTYNMKVVAGRNIVPSDTITEMLVNEAFVRQMDVKNTEDVLGRKVFADNSGTTGVIVGVVKDFHHNSLMNGIEPTTLYYFPQVFNQLGVKLSVDDPATLKKIESLWKKYFPDDVLRYTFLDDSVSKVYRVEQATGRFMTMFSVACIVICFAGILGISAFANLKRTKEMSIRKVLGASEMNIVLLLCRQYVPLFMSALFVAIPLTWFLMRDWLDQYVFHIDPDWSQFVLPALGLVFTTLILLMLQSVRTSRLNPAETLKDD